MGQIPRSIERIFILLIILNYASSRPSRAMNGQHGYHACDCVSVCNHTYL